MILLLIEYISCLFERKLLLLRPSQSTGYPDLILAKESSVGNQVHFLINSSIYFSELLPLSMSFSEPSHCVRLHQATAGSWHPLEL